MHCNGKITMQQLTSITAISTLVSIFNFVSSASYFSLFAVLSSMPGVMWIFIKRSAFLPTLLKTDSVLFFSSDYVTSLCPGASTSSKHINKCQAIRCSMHHFPILLLLWLEKLWVADQLILHLSYDNGNIECFFSFHLWFCKGYFLCFFQEN